MKTKKAKTKRELQKEGVYTASILIWGKLYSATGATTGEAISNLKPQGSTRGIGILTVAKPNGEIRERILSPLQVVRLFTPSRIMREIALKNVSLLFGL